MKLVSGILFMLVLLAGAHVEARAQYGRKTTEVKRSEEQTLVALERRTWELIKRREEGDNDGLVSVTSQRWTDRLRGTSREKKVEQHHFPVLGDHFNQVGWWEVHQLSGKFRLSTLLNPITAVRGLLDDRREYENQIKGTYLSMAEDLESRFPV